MLIEHTLDTLRRLKLTGMAQAYTRQLEQAACGELSFDERLGLLVDHECTSRDNRRLTRLLQLARFKQNACAEDIDYRQPRGLDRSQVASLLTCHWIRAHQQLLITGPTGCGKSWLACALGHQASAQRAPAWDSPCVTNGPHGCSTHCASRVAREASPSVWPRWPKPTC